MNLNMNGKKVIITGGTKGIGRASALQLAEEGAEITLCARNQNDIDELVQTINDKGGKASGSAVDLYNPQSFITWLTQSAETMGGVDVFISNVTGGTALGMDAWSAWKEFFDVDLMSAVKGVETLMPYLQKSNAASVIFISSTAAIEHFAPAPPGFMALKAALITHAKTLAHHHGKDGIRVNTVCPGPIYVKGGAWEFVENEMPELYTSTLTQIPMGRMGTAEEVAQLVTFLASPAASFITGSNYVIDGGLCKGI
ncbi:MAG: 3-oxoacyl-[acyl-carrier protein] reductase [Shewanella sp.]|jgi:3-oxoacyl-[acyl-carrier protein] reductase